MKIWLTSVTFVLICGFASAASAQSSLIDQAESVLNEKPAAANVPAQKTAQKPAPAPAQKSSGGNGGSLLDSLDSLFGDSQSIPSGDASSSTLNSKPASKTAANNVAFDTSYKTVNNVLLADKLTAGENKNDPQVKSLNDFVHQAWSEYQQAALRNGLKFNDLAAAMSYAVSLNFEVYNNTAPESAAQQRALYAQMKQMLAANKNVAALTDADKQLYAEIMVFKATVPVLYRTKNRQQNNGASQPKAEELAAQNLTQLLGADFADFRFTNNGLEK